MKKNRCALSALVLALFTGARLAAFDLVSYNWFTDTTGTIHFYDSEVNPITSAWTFELGVFSAAADFNDASSLAANFTSIRTFAWEIDIEGSGLNGAQALSINYSYLGGGYPDGIAGGSQVSVWAYNYKAATSGSEWVVVTNPSWVLAALTDGSSAFDTDDWTITDPGTQYLIGALVGNQVIAAAVPEPGAYTLLFSGITSVWCLRRRQGRRDAGTRASKNMD